MTYYKFKKKPYKHQVAALKDLLARGWGGALLMEPRTGKTKVVCDYIGVLHLAKGVNRVLLIMPVVAIEVWKRELRENLPFKFRMTVWDKTGRKEVDLPKFGSDILDIVIVNYDAFAQPGTMITNRKGERVRSKSRGGRFDMKKKFRLWQPQLIVLDESHRIKSPSAKKSTAMHSLAKLPEYKVIMTGTVVTKSKKLYDVYSQWLFLNPERFKGMTFAQFKSRYGRWVEMNHYALWKGSRNTEELHTLMHMDSFSITREECYDLPKMTPQIIPVALEYNESGRIYDEMAEDMVARIESGEITEATIRLVQGLRLRQITSGITKTSPTPEYPKGRLMVIGSEKLRAIEERLEDLMEADEKVVIGALWRGDIARLEAVGKKLKVPTFSIHGGVKQRDRGRIPEEFKKVSGGAIVIGQPQAASEAIDLSAASIMQWYSLPQSWVQFKQMSDRIALSDKPTFHEFYLAQGTIDFMAYQTLMEDGDIGKKMIQSPERLLRLGQSFDDADDWD